MLSALLGNKYKLHVKNKLFDVVTTHYNEKEALTLIIKELKCLCFYVSLSIVVTCSSVVLIVVC